MTRLITCGWETGNLNEAGLSLGDPSSVVSSNPTPRVGGGFCLSAAMTYNGAVSYIRFDLASALTEFWLRVGVMPRTVGQTWVSNGSFLYVFDPSFGVQLSVGHNTNTDRQFTVNFGSVWTTQIAATATPGGYAVDTWHLVELHWQASSSATGLTELFVNGRRVINISADNTATGFSNMQSIGLGTFGPPGTAQAQFAIDDFAFNDTTGTTNNGQIGDGRVILLRPNAAGDVTALGRGGTDTGANFSQVSEAVPSMAQYVTSATPTAQDLYRLTDPPANTISVSSIDVIALAQLNDTGPGSLGLTVKSSSTPSEAAAQALSSSPSFYRAHWETDPNTSAAWLPLAVTNLQAGVTIR